MGWQTQGPRCLPAGLGAPEPASLSEVPLGRASSQAMPWTRSTTFLQTALRSCPRALLLLLGSEGESRGRGGTSRCRRSTVPATGAGTQQGGQEAGLGEGRMARGTVGYIIRAVHPHGH